MGLLIGARLADQPVVLSGGSQMIALILLALEILDFQNKVIESNSGKIKKISSNFYS